jgi:hypothetical protein
MPCIKCAMRDSAHLIGSRHERALRRAKCARGSLSQLETGLTAEVGRVFLREVGPLLRQVVQGKDGRDGAGGDACTAVDAFDRINEQLVGVAVAVFVLLGVDAIDRTGVHTGGVLGADTGFCNDVCHLKNSPGDLLSTLIVAQLGGA